MQLCFGPVAVMKMQLFLVWSGFKLAVHHLSNLSLHVDKGKNRNAAICFYSSPKPFCGVQDEGFKHRGFVIPASVFHCFRAAPSQQRARNAWLFAGNKIIKAVKYIPANLNVPVAVDNLHPLCPHAHRYPWTRSECSRIPVIVLWPVFGSDI